MSFRLTSLESLSKVKQIQASFERAKRYSAHAQCTLFCRIFVFVAA